jgi:uncharacterized protein YbbC (DUF1343 family)
MTTGVATGLDLLQSQKYALLKGKRVALLTHPAAINRDMVSAYDLFSQAREVDLRTLFSPEHGLRGVIPAGEKVPDMVDSRTGTIVYSLYGETLIPTPEMLRGLDLLVIDLQDIGIRYYTYGWTMTIVLETAGAQGIPVLLLDRPNPLGGEKISGPGVNTGFESLVGRIDVPVIHGMTIGEMAQYYNAVHNPTPADLTVIPCFGLERRMTWSDTRLPFVATSPAMAQLSTVQHYAGSCLIEGTKLSEGRGTSLPFEVVGAPMLDGEALAERLNSQNWPGVKFRAHYFSPGHNKHTAVSCGGVQAHITDVETFDALRVWTGVVWMLRQGFPQVFEWLPPHSKVHHFDRLIGSEGPRVAIERGATLDEITEGWVDNAEAFRKRRREFLLYPEVP